MRQGGTEVGRITDDVIAAFDGIDELSTHLIGPGVHSLGPAQGQRCDAF